MLLASGLTLVLGILGVPNFAQGHLYMLGAYLCYYLVMPYAINYWLSLILVTIALGLMGLIIERLIFRPMRDAPEVNLFVAALGLLMVLEGGALYLFGPRSKYIVTSFSREVITVADLAFPVQRLIVIGGTIIVMICLWLFTKKTTLGAALEATAQNRQGAMLCGIKVRTITAMAFAIGTALAGVAGVLVAPSLQVNPHMGLGPLLIAFAAVIFGGLGSVPGAVLGGFVMAIVESLASGYISAKYSWVFIFLILIMVMMFRPAGLLRRTA